MGSFAGAPLPTSVEGRIHVWGGGFDLAGDLALTLRQIAPDGEEGTSCVGTDGDADGDGGLDTNFDCDDGDPLVYVGAAELDDPTACMADADGDCDDADATLDLGDADADGYTTCDADCDDADARTSPVGVDTLRDHDCDGAVGVGTVSLGYAEIAIVGPRASAFVGYSAASAGDVDGDGLADVLVTAANVSGATDEAYLVLGSTLASAGPIVDLATDADYVFDGLDFYFLSAAGLGDIDGDGADDFAISSPTTATSHTYVFLAADLGSTRALSTSAARRSLAGGEAWTGGVAGLGDLDGDGLGELAVGELGGATYVVPGSVATTRGSSSLYASADAIIPASLGGGVVGAAGDLDVDGLGEVLIAARTSSEAAATAGRVWLVPGSEMAAAGEVDLALAYSFTGEGAGDQAGLSLASAGDIDGDGAPDVLVSSPYHDASAADEGVVYVLLSGL